MTSERDGTKIVTFAMGLKLACSKITVISYLFRYAETIACCF